MFPSLSHPVSPSKGVSGSLGAFPFAWLCLPSRGSPVLALIPECLWSHLASPGLPSLPGSRPSMTTTHIRCDKLFLVSCGFPRPKTLPNPQCHTAWKTESQSHSSKINWELETKNKETMFFMPKVQPLYRPVVACSPLDGRGWKALNGAMKTHWEQQLGPAAHRAEGSCHQTRACGWGTGRWPQLAVFHWGIRDAQTAKGQGSWLEL